MLKCALSRFVLLVILLLSASACSTLHSTAKETKKLYTEYVEPTPEVSLDYEDAGESYEVRLAKLMMPVDERIHDLRQFMDGTDKTPSDEWYQKLFASYPWITGVMVVDTQGVTSFQYPPEAALRPLNIQPLLDYGEAWSDHKIRGYAEQTDMGPEVYLASPLFADNLWSGLVIVHFDPRRLAEFCPNPDELIIVSPDAVLLSGGSDVTAKALSCKPWKEILHDEVFGETPIGGAEFYWVARYLGHYYLIYATLAEGTVGTVPPEELVPPKQTEDAPKEEAVEQEEKAQGPVPEGDITPGQDLPLTEEQEIHDDKLAPDDSADLDSEYEVIMGTPEELEQDNGSWWLW